MFGRLRTLLDRALFRLGLKHVWKGVYDAFDAVPATNTGYQSEKGRERAMNKLRQDWENMRSEPLVRHTAAPLPLLLASLTLRADRPIRVLDFGGGLGMTFLEVLSCGLAPKAVEYHIKDLPRVCDDGEDFWKDKPSRPFFHQDLPDGISFDVVHFGSALHYLKDWKDDLLTILKGKPSYLLFVDLPAGKNSTYCTGQNYYGEVIPVRFFKLEEFLAEMPGLGLELVYHAQYRGTILGKQQPFPQDNFEERYRVGDTRVLLYRREDS